MLVTRCLEYYRKREWSEQSIYVEDKTIIAATYPTVIGLGKLFIGLLLPLSLFLSTMSATERSSNEVSPASHHSYSVLDEFNVVTTCHSRSRFQGGNTGSQTDRSSASPVKGIFSTSGAIELTSEPRSRCRSVKQMGQAIGSNKLNKTQANERNTNETNRWSRKQRQTKIVSIYCLITTVPKSTRAHAPKLSPRDLEPSLSWIKRVPCRPATTTKHQHRQ